MLENILSKNMIETGLISLEKLYKVLMKENNLFFFFLLIPVVSRKFTDPFFLDGKLYIYRRRINTIINLCGSFTQTLTSPNLVWQSSWISQNAFSPLFLITLE